MGTAEPRADERLSSLVEHWVASGIVTPAQAALMRQDLVRQEAAPTAPPAHRVSTVEALGYLGGVIVLISVTAIAAQGWADLATEWRLLVVGAAAVVPLGAGALVPDRLGEIGVRLRSALWLVSTAALAGFVALLTDEALDLGPHAVGLTTAATTAVYAAVLWSAHDTVAQQAATMVAIGITAAAAIDVLDLSHDLNGAGVFGTGVAWAVLAWRGVLWPERFGLAAGSAMAVIGAMTTSNSDAGLALVLVTVACVGGLAVWRRDLVLLAIATVGVLQGIPAALSRWFPDSEAVPYVLLLVGVCLVLSAVRVARRTAPVVPEQRRPAPRTRR